MYKDMFSCLKNKKTAPQKVKRFSVFGMKSYCCTGTEAAFKTVLTVDLVTNATISQFSSFQDDFGENSYSFSYVAASKVITSPRATVAISRGTPLWI